MTSRLPARLAPALSLILAGTAPAAPHAPAALTTKPAFLCCGRGGPPAGERPAQPLEARSSPWSGDLILAFEDHPAQDLRALEPVVTASPGVSRVEVDPTGHFMRVWLDPVSPVATTVTGRVVAQLAARGAHAVPAVMTPVRFDQAGEKGLIPAVEAALRRAEGTVSFEVEVEGEEAVARVWHRPGADMPRLVTVLASIGVHAWLPTHAPTASLPLAENPGT